MKSLAYIIVLVFINSILFAQERNNITILVKSTDNVAISSAHLTLDGDEHFISDQNGLVVLQSSKNLIKIEISHIGYIKLDTILNIDLAQNHSLSLIANSYTIDPITISDKQRLFEKEKWAINDITYHDYGFLVSASERSKKYIYLFDHSGLQILKTRTKFKHNSIINGHKSGHYHLMNDRKGQEILVSTDTIIFLNIEPIEKYDKTLHRFKYTNSKYSITEEWAAHNKRFTLSNINNKSFERTPFYDSYDEEASIRAQSLYNFILSEYYKESETDNYQSINVGFNKENVLREKTWSGDLYDLVITDTIQELYADYMVLYNKEVKISTQIKNNQLYVLDDFKRKMTIYSLEPDKIDPNYIEKDIPIEIKEGKFINSTQSNELIILSNDRYFSYHISNQSFTPIEYESKDYYFPKTIFSDKNMLYVLAQRSKTKYKRSIFRCNRLK